MMYQILPVKRYHIVKGGEGSGNFGHAGRPGEVGGSGGGGGEKQSWPLTFVVGSNTREESKKFIEDAYAKIPASEKAKSDAEKVVIHDDPFDTFLNAERLGYIGGIDISTDILFGFYDYGSHTIYTTVLNSVGNDSARNFLHEFGHSVRGADEWQAESWVKDFFPEYQ